MGRKFALTGILFVIASLFLKVSGLLRDILIAFYFGNSYQAVAYFAAFTLPNMFILFFSMGMKDAFVPSFIHASKDGKGYHHFSQVTRGAIVFGLFVSAMGVVLSPFLLRIFFSDLSAEALDLSTGISMILFVAVFFVSLNSVYEAYLDAESKFSLTVISQIVVIGSTILSAVLFSAQIGAYSLALGYLGGAILSYLLKRFWFVPKDSHKIFGKLDWDEIKPFTLIFIPVAITVMVGQINLTIDNIFAGSINEQAVTYINYAKNLVHFPQAIIGVTIGTIIFPLLSKSVANNNQSGFKKSIEHGLVFTLFLLLPAIAGMMWLLQDLVTIVYERGAFNSDTTDSTVMVGYLYAGSVLFFSLQSILNKAFYSKKKGQVILKVSLFSVLLNVALNFLFISLLDSYIGIPLASSVMAIVYFSLNVWVFTKLEGKMDYKYVLKDSVKILLATGVMILGLWFTSQFMADLNLYLRFALTILIGAIIYTVTILAMRTTISNFLITKLKR